VATEADAVRNRIPAGYCIKHWHPDETPILLLGSVFDAESLGKWIFDWTVFCHSASDEAGDLWLLLVKLSGKMKLATECFPRIKDAENRKIVCDFLKSGDRLWERFEKMLENCEFHMWKAAERKGKGVVMGTAAGRKVVESIFGHDLDNTTRLMDSISTWDKRFDANCSDIFRRR